MVLPVFLAARAVSASPLDLYGGSAEGIALSGAETAQAEDGMATYFNPAGLGVGGSSGKFAIHLGYSYAANQELFIQRSAATAAAAPALKPTSIGYVVGSALFPLGGPIHHKASFGVAFAVPQDTLLKAHASEPIDPQWLRFSTEADRIAVAAGLGVRPIPQLAIGVAVSEFATFLGSDSFTLMQSQGANQASTLTNRDITFSLAGATAAIAGVTFVPNDDWRISIAYRGALELKESLPDAATVPNLVTLNIGSDGELMYTPHTISAGATWKPTSGLKVGVDLRYEMWSLAPVPDFNVSITTTGPLASTFGSLLNGATVQPDIRFHDTLTPTAFAAYSWHDRMFTVRGSYSYRPTYLPKPGYTSAPGQNSPVQEDYLDTDAHIIGVGGTLEVFDGIGLFPNGLDIDLGFAGQILPRVSVNPAVPEGSAPSIGPLAFGGVVLVGGAALRTTY
jgi:opacity protein-like surface antigen